MQTVNNERTQHRRCCNIVRGLNRLNSILRRINHQLEWRDREVMEKLCCSNEIWEFYKKVNQPRKGCVPHADMCRDLNGNLLTEDCELMERWKHYYGECINGDVADHESNNMTIILAACVDLIRRLGLIRYPTSC